MDLRKVAVKELVVIGKLLFMENELSMTNGFRGVCHIHLDTFFPRLKGGMSERERALFGSRTIPERVSLFHSRLPIK